LLPPEYVAVIGTKSVLRKFLNQLRVSFTLVLFLLSISLVNAQSNDAQNSLQRHATNLSSELEFEYFEASQKRLELEEVTKLPDESWRYVKQNDATFGFSQSQFWLRVTIENKQLTTQNIVFELAYPLLDDVTFYAISTSGKVRTLSTGDSKPFYPRDIAHPNMLMRLQLDAGQSTKVYAKVESQGAMILPVRIWYENQFFEFAMQEQRFHFFYYGFLSVIMLINLAIAFTLREKLYLYYALATSGYLIFFATARGYANQLFFPDFPWLSTQLFLSSMPLLALFSLLFAREFLQTKKHSPKLDIAIRAMIYFEYFNLFASFALAYNTAVQLSAVSALVLFVLLFFAGPISCFVNRRAGIFFTVAWIPLTIGFAATAGRSSGVLANNFFTEYAMQLGSGLEALILTLALADRLYREREQKIEAQAVSIQQEQRRLAIQDKLSEAMTRDPITKLANRNSFERLANHLFEKQKDQGYVVCVAKITRLNEISNTLGLLSVERILRAIALRMDPIISDMPGAMSIENASGTANSVFQLSGDTFGILINRREFERNVEEYHGFIQNMLLPIDMDSLSIELGPRVGCALYPEHGADAAILLRNALVAMESSQLSDDQVVYYDHALDIYNESRLTLMADLREAIRLNSLTLYYQPKLNLKDNSISGLEALVRWQHPQRGFVSPQEFVTLAEQTGVIKDLTLWVLEQSAKDLKRLRNGGYQGHLSINISARDLLNPRLKLQIQSIFSTYDVDPTKVFLELTETAAMDEPEAGLAALNELASLGLKISIDDFGAGYSSLSYLQQLPASEIKLDRSFITDIQQSEGSQLIVKASIDMAHGLGYSVVAEGVEDFETYLLMKGLGCDELQGYWLCRPKPLSEITKWLLARDTVYEHV
jgi:EAL domain-containing protein (putative c-di-GMP-specific phosphodiesterase class I)/GGDEF domain-containing protein